MTKAIRVHKTGGPEVLSWEEISVGHPGQDDARIRHTAIGVNFIDIYHRTGLYPVPELPFTPGIEAAGIIEELGDEVFLRTPALNEGDRVVYASPPVGAYSEARIIDASRLVQIPKEIDDRTAAALFQKGLTAWYLLRQTYVVQPGDSVLIHAAAGGVGLLLSQWARHLGALVIGTVGNDEKAELALANGCHHAIRYDREDFVARVKDITDGRGVHVVYDSVGKDTFTGSLDCLRPRGMMVSFGQSSGLVPSFQLSELSSRGSLFITRPVLMDYTSSRDILIPAAREVFDAFEKGILRVTIHRELPLARAADAQIALEARKTVGSTILMPDG
uniref:NADPH:quinone reductase n=1 Tax=Candidatus Kentrum sp. MB TaxID=2138164 RepID=A0A450XPU6_9GAMM|nr:MAG: NADPH2:quinone reductase [Candidatus Kentron sp. MB]VFK34708.1 MAG: NADPH2:quinone reductase [Candidatus Kentron sp. MB]VFK76958.1 MAG: NADPH2:quinone reductase [Candidatus Kentron sp. MB]